MYLYLFVEDSLLTSLKHYRFSQVHEFEKPNDEAALNLMDSCSAAVLEEYPDIIFAYGFSDEYRFTVLTLFFLGFYTLTLSPLNVFCVSSVVLYSRKRQDSTKDDPGIDSSKPDRVVETFCIIICGFVSLIDS